MSNDFDEVRLKIILSELRRDYLAQCEPYIKQLAAIEATRMPSILISHGYASQQAFGALSDEQQEEFRDNMKSWHGI